MTREEAIVYFESLLKRFEEMRETETSYWGKVHTETTIEAIRTALAALRPVSREQVEKMKKEPVEGEYDELYAPTYKCPECGFENIGRGNFCRNCGCLHTDEAVDMMMKRWEALKDGKGDQL